MKRSVRLIGSLGLLVVGVGSFMGMRTAGADPIATEPAAVGAPAPSVPVHVNEPVSATDSSALVAGRGMTCRPVSPALASHLGLAQGEGLVIVAIQDDSPAAQAELEEFDVILMVDREAAGLERVRAAVMSQKGLSLRVVRTGVVRDVALPPAPAVESRPAAQPTAFLSSDKLGPDHPFRRVRQAETLREHYSSQAKEYSERMRALDDDARKAREDAKNATRELQEACEVEVAEYLAARQVELLAILDEGLTDERIQSLRELRLELESVLPRERVDAIRASLDELTLALRETTGERAQLNGTEELASSIERQRQRFRRIGESASSLIEKRVLPPYGEVRSHVDAHHERLTTGHDGRVDWAAKTLNATREKLRERVTCAIDRAREEFSKRLRRRLSELEVPAPGEIEASLADLSEQLETMTRRFVARSNAALDLYESELAARARVLAPALARSLDQSEAAANDLKLSLENLFEEHLAQAIEFEGTWKDVASVDRAIDFLRVELLRRVDAARDAMRAGTVALETQFHEERVISDDAWANLKSLFGEVHQQAQSDCWKLDGPHLDGRFPRGERNDEVAMLER